MDVLRKFWEKFGDLVFGLTMLSLLIFIATQLSKDLSPDLDEDNKAIYEKWKKENPSSTVKP